MLVNHAPTPSLLVYYAPKDNSILNPGIHAGTVPQVRPQ
jgi:hypothetical protein